METIRIKEGDIHIGCPLPWAIYSAESSLLLRKGSIVSSDRQLQMFVANGMFRSLTEQEISAKQLEQKRSKTITNDPFLGKNQCAEKVDKVLKEVAEKRAQNIAAEVSDICEQLQIICENYPDATLGAIHLCPEHQYSVLHPLHTAILSDLLAKRINIADQKRRSTMAAALMMNVGMLEIQNTLFYQKDPLTEQQKAVIHNHPLESIKLLQLAGITDIPCLDAIRQHHEKIDGSGYPLNLKDEQIGEEAKIIALADMYSAMITPRKHRRPILAKDALKSIFEKRGKAVDETLAAQFIREVGVFPPGAFVRLANGEIAVVTKRAIGGSSRDSTAPTVYSILSPRGGVIKVPPRRNCTLDSFKIIRLEHVELSEPMNFEQLWNR